MDWIDEHDWDLAATFTMPANTNKAQAEKTFRHYWNLVDKAVYGRAAKRHSKRVERVCFVEGEKNGNIHWHVIAKSNERRDYRWLRQIMLIAWEDLSNTGRYNEVTRCFNNNGWAGYISKQIRTFDADAWDVVTTHITG